MPTRILVALFMICATITGAVAIEISSSKGSTCIDYLHIQQLVNAQNEASGNSSGGMVSGFQLSESTSNPDPTGGLGCCLGASPFSAHPGRDC